MVPPTKVSLTAPYLHIDHASDANTRRQAEEALKQSKLADPVSVLARFLRSFAACKFDKVFAPNVKPWRHFDHTNHCFLLHTDKIRLQPDQGALWRVEQLKCTSTGCSALQEHTSQHNPGKCHQKMKFSTLWHIWTEGIKLIPSCDFASRIFLSKVFEECLSANV